MSDSASSQETLVTDSGGVATLLHPESYADPSPAPDLSLLENQRMPDVPGPFRPAGAAPYFGPGDVVTWHWGKSIETLRVVRDDDRGLVAWLPTASEVLLAAPLDGRGVRDRPVSERFTTPHDMRLRTWRGPGILRVAPAGKPWSIWYFWEDGRFEGHYVNLELPHVRPADGGPHVLSRDLVLDVWLEEGPEGRQVWLKDADELEAAVEAGRFTPEQGLAIRAIGEQAAYELGHRASWPLDEGWETYRPPAGWDAPLTLPDLPSVVAARARA